MANVGMHASAAVALHRGTWALLAKAQQTTQQLLNMLMGV
jgi:hypothetical protein